MNENEKNELQLNINRDTLEDKAKDLLVCDESVHKNLEFKVSDLIVMRSVCTCQQLFIAKNVVSTLIFIILILVCVNSVSIMQNNLKFRKLIEIMS